MFEKKKNKKTTTFITFDGFVAKKGDDNYRAFFDGFATKKVTTAMSSPFSMVWWCCENKNGNKWFPFSFFFGPFGQVH